MNAADHIFLACLLVLLTACSDPAAALLELQTCDPTESPTELLRLEGTHIASPVDAFDLGDAVSLSYALERDADPSTVQGSFAVQRGRQLRRLAGASSGDLRPALRRSKRGRRDRPVRKRRGVRGQGRLGADGGREPRVRLGSRRPMQHRVSPRQQRGGPLALPAERRRGVRRDRGRASQWTERGWTPARVDARARPDSPFRA